MKIYTKTGDSGDTGLYGGERRSKSDFRVTAFGEIDELQAALGVAGAHSTLADLGSFIEQVQNDCFVISAMLARTETNPSRNDPVLAETRVVWLEKQVDAWDAALQPLTSFILQGGSVPAAQLYLARAVCRRAERAVVAMHKQEPVDGTVLRYLNRLSDALFTAGRFANYQAGITEAEWHPHAN